MQPIDYRNATWEEVIRHLNRDRERVYNALLRFGPITTRGLAAAMGCDILSVRPRVTELFQLGFVLLAEGSESTGREGIYVALSWIDARHHFEARKAQAQPRQLSLL